jgi:hypothetical protein
VSGALERVSAASLGTSEGTVVDGTRLVADAVGTLGLALAGGVRAAGGGSGLDGLGHRRGIGVSTLGRRGSSRDRNNLGGDGRRRGSRGGDLASDILFV